jgi:DNA-binding CsgD family transcriptional regulator
MRVSEGSTTKEAAAALFISPRTVEAHLNRIYRKLGVRSRAQLTRIVLEGHSPAAEAVGGRT